MRNIPHIYICVILVLLAACSPVKYVAEDELLLDNVKIAVVGDYPDIDTKQLKSYVRQNANSRWFGAFKIPLGAYSLSGRDSSRWINRMLKNMGEAPVIYDSVKTQLTCRDLCMALQNEGYLNAAVQSEMFNVKNKKTGVRYLLYPGKPFFVDKVHYDINDSQIAGLLESRGGVHGMIKEGMKFNVNTLNDERKRITNILVNNGYYKFHKDFMHYTVDTLQGSDKVGVTLNLMPYRTNAIADTLHPIYTIGSIKYMPGITATGSRDSRIHLRSGVLRRNTKLTEGQPYSAEGLQDTYNSFGRLSAVRYTNITFEEKPGNILDCNIQISTKRPNSISFEPEGTNTAGDLGAAASLTYQNRNLFRGSELLSVQMRGAFEAIRGLEGYANSNFVEYGIESRLTFPRFLLPFFSTSFLQRSNMNTEVQVMFDNQNRPE